jgi:hypothetical protein
MGETTGELRQAVDSKREDAAQKIEMIEQKVGETTQQVKDTFDWRRQVEEKPLVALGAAFIGGIVLGGVMGGDENGQQQRPTQYWQSSKKGRGLTGSIRNAAKSSGLEDSINEMASGFFGSLSSRVKEMASDTFSSSADQSRPSHSTGGQTVQM